jgi:hypothetical protein
MNILPLIEKIHLLESKIGHRRRHTILDPFKFDSSDCIKVQEAGKKIAHHIGLPAMTFIVSYATQNEGAAGHVKLDYSNEVFVEISYKYKNDCDIVLSILAHELCHKYLQIENLKCFPEFENEMLTDAATIYTGLGKLSLNGCEKTNKDTSTVGNTTTTTTSTQKVGYMNREQFAFVYRLICEMRRIQQNDFLQGLTHEASLAVQNIGLIYVPFFNSNFFNGNYTLDMVSQTAKDEINESQINFATFHKDTRIIRETILKIADVAYKEYHNFIRKECEKLTAAASKDYSQEAHNYIKNLMTLEELKNFKIEANKKNSDIEKLRNNFSKFVRSIAKNETNDFLFTFECPCCSSKMRISQKKLARLKCTNCNYSFIVDTGNENVTETTTQKNKLKTKKKGFYDQIASLFNKTS